MVISCARATFPLLERGLVLLPNPPNFPFLASSLPVVFSLLLPPYLVPLSPPFNIRCAVPSVPSYFRLTHPSIFGSLLLILIDTEHGL